MTLLSKLRTLKILVYGESSQVKNAEIAPAYRLCFIEIIANKSPCNRTGYRDLVYNINIRLLILRQQRKLQKRVEECEKRVAQIEPELKELEEWMAAQSGADFEKRCFDNHKTMCFNSLDMLLCAMLW